jgi:hypothetical protein
MAKKAKTKLPSKKAAKARAKKAVRRASKSSARPAKRKAKRKTARTSKTNHKSALALLIDYLNETGKNLSDEMMRHLTDVKDEMNRRFGGK